ncbi:MAG: DUF502 domain-containing protein [Kiritimatiellae bacterium]|nr:DUF502 domain-containing protein [Kiritimatiellia bacterium]
MTTGDPSPLSRLGRHVRTRLFSGLLITIPLLVTWMVLRFLFRVMSGLLEPLLRPWLSDWPRPMLPIISLLAIVVLIYLAGLIAAFVVGRRLIRLAESFLMKLPLVSHVYAAAKQVVSTFSQRSRTTFKAAVVVSFPYPGARSLGFVTGTITGPEGQMLYRVFVPTAPNPTSGFVLLLAPEEVQFTNITIEDGVKMMVSGGLVAPPEYKLAEPPSTLDSAEAPTTDRHLSNSPA